LEVWRQRPANRLPGGRHHIQIGELAFQDCIVSSATKNSVGNEDGLIGADVFASYLIDIDLPGMRLVLSPLPTRLTIPPLRHRSTARAKAI